jgi:hypothetical protein
MRRELLAEKHGEELLFLSEEYFDEAIVGVTNDDRVVYDMDKMIEVLCHESNCDAEEAIEYLEFNTWRAYVGESTPVYIQRRD